MSKITLEIDTENLDETTLSIMGALVVENSSEYERVDLLYNERYAKKAPLFHKDIKFNYPAIQFSALYSASLGVVRISAKIYDEMLFRYDEIPFKREIAMAASPAEAMRFADEQFETAKKDFDALFAPQQAVAE